MNDQQTMIETQKESTYRALSKLDGEPAFPCTDGAHGMSLRDYFAAKALMGLLSKLPVLDQEGTFGPSTDDKIKYNRDVAESCYWIADAMLLARQTNIT